MDLTRLLIHLAIFLLLSTAVMVNTMVGSGA